MKKNILLIFSFLTSAITFAQIQTDSTSVDSTGVPAVADTIIEKVIETPIQTQTRHFGYLSYTEVMKVMPEYSQAQSSLEKLKEYYDQEMDRAEQEFSKKFSEYIDGYKSFPENIMLKRQKELQQLMEQSMSFKKEAQQLLNNSEKELMDPIYRRLNEALKTIGTERNFNYILNTDGNIYPFINTINGEGIDITDDVIKLVK